MDAELETHIRKRLPSESGKGEMDFTAGESSLLVGCIITMQSSDGPLKKSDTRSSALVGTSWESDVYGTSSHIQPAEHMAHEESKFREASGGVISSRCANPVVAVEFARKGLS